MVERRSSEKLRGVCPVRMLARALGSPGAASMALSQATAGSAPTRRAAMNTTWSPWLLRALLEELHVEETFVELMGNSIKLQPRPDTEERGRRQTPGDKAGRSEILKTRLEQAFHCGSRHA